MGFPRLITSVPCDTNKWHQILPGESSIWARRECAGPVVPAVFCTVPKSTSPCWVRLSRGLCLSWRPTRQALIYWSKARLHSSQHPSLFLCCCDKMLSKTKLGRKELTWLMLQSTKESPGRTQNKTRQKPGNRKWSRDHRGALLNGLFLTFMYSGVSCTVKAYLLRDGPNWSRLSLLSPNWSRLISFSNQENVHKRSCRLAR